jgi:prepilin-type N-terminal cleavage/methylation domain-containing protein
MKLQSCFGPRTKRRDAFTLIELLVSIAIIAILTAILLSAVQAARESSRRVVCINNARQLALATLNCADTQHGVLPASWRTSNPAPWDNFSWRATVLPFMENQALFDQLELKESPLDEMNRTAIQQQLSLFQCPSTPESPRLVDALGADDESYQVAAGAQDFSAIFAVVSPIRSALLRGVWHGGPKLNVTVIGIGQFRPDTRTAELRSLQSKLRYAVDGLSKTALLVEQAAKPTELGRQADDDPHPPMEGAWATCDYGMFHGSGINTNNYMDPFGFHGGATTALCDGSVIVLSEDIFREIMVSLFSRNGSEIVGTSDWQ